MLLPALDVNEMKTKFGFITDLRYSITAIKMFHYIFNVFVSLHPMFPLFFIQFHPKYFAHGDSVLIMTHEFCLPYLLPHF